jgi:hypothetical protein
MPCQQLSAGFIYLPHSSTSIVRLSAFLVCPFVCQFLCPFAWLVYPLPATTPSSSLHFVYYPLVRARYLSLRSTKITWDLRNAHYIYENQTQIICYVGNAGNPRSSDGMIRKAPLTPRRHDHRKSPFSSCKSHLAKSLAFLMYSNG